MNVIIGGTKHLGIERFLESQNAFGELKKCFAIVGPWASVDDQARCNVVGAEDGDSGSSTVQLFPVDKSAATARCLKKVLDEAHLDCSKIAVFGGRVSLSTLKLLCHSAGCISFHDCLFEATPFQIGAIAQDKDIAFIRCDLLKNFEATKFDKNRPCKINSLRIEDSYRLEQQLRGGASHEFANIDVIGGLDEKSWLVDINTSACETLSLCSIEWHARYIEMISQFDRLRAFTLDDVKHFEWPIAQLHLPKSVQGIIFGCGVRDEMIDLGIGFPPTLSYLWLSQSDLSPAMIDQIMLVKSVKEIMLSGEQLARCDPKMWSKDVQLVVAVNADEEAAKRHLKPILQWASVKYH